MVWSPSCIVQETKTFWEVGEFAATSEDTKFHPTKKSPRVWQAVWQVHPSNTWLFRWTSLHLNPGSKVDSSEGLDGFSSQPLSNDVTHVCSPADNAVWIKTQEQRLWEKLGNVQKQGLCFSFVVFIHWYLLFRETKEMVDKVARQQGRWRQSHCSGTLVELKVQPNRLESCQQSKRRTPAMLRP